MTLIEVLVTVMIVAIVGKLGMDAISGANANFRADRAAKETVAALRYARILAMTSGGGERVLPSYGAVSAAKAALASHVRQLACELVPRGITANAILAGVIDTPAVRKIPGSEALFEEARRRNPSGRLGTTEDVARAIAALIHPQTSWMTGNVIRVDGGESIVG